MNPVKVAVVGASGYSGQELIRILMRHPGVDLVCVTSRQYAGQTIAEIPVERQARSWRGPPHP